MWRPALKSLPTLCAPQKRGKRSIKALFGVKAEHTCTPPLLPRKEGRHRGANTTWSCTTPPLALLFHVGSDEESLVHAATWWLPPRASGAQAASSRAPPRPPAMVVVWDLPRLPICWRAGPAPPAPGCKRAAPSDVSQAARAFVVRKECSSCPAPAPFKALRFPASHMSPFPI